MKNPDHPDDDPDLSALIRRHATRHAASDELRAAVRTQVALAEAGRARVPRAGWRERWQRWAWRGPAAGFAAGVLAALLVGTAWLHLDLGRPLPEQVVAQHVQALGVGPLVEVLSTDRHTVKPWFQGRIDYAPPVRDLGAAGFPLTGGRISPLGGRPVAALAYQRQRHVIDLYIWPSEAQAVPQLGSHRGFNLVHWADGTMQFWAVSDVEPAELQRFVQAWQAAATGT